MVKVNPRRIKVLAMDMMNRYATPTRLKPAMPNAFQDRAIPDDFANGSADEEGVLQMVAPKLSHPSQIFRGLKESRAGSQQNSWRI